MDLRDIISDIMDTISDNEDIKGISNSFKSYKQSVQYGSDRYRPYVAPLEAEDDNYDLEDSTLQTAREDYDNKSEEQKPVYQGKEGIESITGEITPYKLQQAIILSELINKPVCKRRRNGFRRV